MSPRGLLRNGAARLLYLSGWTLPRRQARGRLSIVTFHRVLPEHERACYPYPGLVVTPSELDALLAYFAAHFDCGPLAVQHERYIRRAHAERPLLALTFDDGQRDNFVHARPLLSRHRLHASFFVPVMAVELQQPLWHDQLGFALLELIRRHSVSSPAIQRHLAPLGLGAAMSGRGLVSIAAQAAKSLSLKERLRFVDDIALASGISPPAFAAMMTFDEVATLAAEGHEIGSHSMTHCLMPECDDEALARELVQSRQILQSRVSAPVESFCYPNGDVDARTAAAVARASYRRAVVTSWGDNGPEADPFQLRRFDMDASRMRGARGNVMAATVAYRMSGFHSMAF